MTKHRYSRRGFMGLSGAGIAGLVGARWAGGIAAAAVDSAQDPDLVVFNAKVYTVDSRAPKEWNVFQPGKKLDPLLVQIGSRYLVVYVRNMEVYELKPELLEHKGEDLLWRESDKPEKPLPTSDWSTKDIGSASRVLVKLVDEGRVVDIQIPQVPDLRRGIY